MTSLPMSNLPTCPKCNGTESYESIVNNRRVAKCKTCSEVMYSRKVQEDLEKRQKASCAIPAVLFVVVVVVVVFLWVTSSLNSI